MSPTPSANLISKEYTGNLTLNADSSREYFLIIMLEGIASVEFGSVKPTETTGGVPLVEGAHYRPSVCPISEIRVISTGTYTIVIG